MGLFPEQFSENTDTHKEDYGAESFTTFGNANISRWRNCFGASGQTRRVGTTEKEQAAQAFSPAPSWAQRNQKQQALHPKHRTILWPPGPPGETVTASVLLRPLRTQSKTGAVGGGSRQEWAHFIRYSWLLLVYVPLWENMLLTRVADSQDSQPSEYKLSDADLSWIVHET